MTNVMVEKIRGRKEERFDRRNRTYRVCDPSKLANGKRYFANPVILIRHKVQRSFAKLRCLIAINRVMTGSGQLTLPRPASVSVRERGARTYDVCIHGTGHRIYIYIHVLNRYTRRTRNTQSRRLELAFLFPDINFGATMRGF